MNPLCWLRTMWRTLWIGAVVSGHHFTTDSEETPDNVHILRCMDCGKISVTWSWESLKHCK